MKDIYVHWITQHVQETYGTCGQVTLDMLAAFPELTRVRGHYYCSSWGERAHWWLVSPDGAIVDPTAQQFPSQGTGTYVPWEEGSAEPTGRCVNCAEYAYDGRDVCSDACGDAFVAVIMEECNA